SQTQVDLFPYRLSIVCFNVIFVLLCRVIIPGAVYQGTLRRSVLIAAGVEGRMRKAAVHFNLQLLVLIFERALVIQAWIETMLGEAAADTIDGAGIHIWAAGYILRLLQLVDIAVRPVAEIVIAQAAGKTVLIGNAPVEPNATLQTMPGKVAAA